MFRVTSCPLATRFLAARLAFYCAAIAGLVEFSTVSFGGQIGFDQSVSEAILHVASLWVLLVPALYLLVVRPWAHDVQKRLRVQYERDRIIDLCPDIIASITLDGAIVQISKAVEPALGWSVADLLGRSVLDFVHPDDLPTVSAGLARVNQSGDANQEVTYRIRHKAGHYKVFTWLSYVDALNRLFYTVGRDVTRHIEADNALKQAHNLLEAEVARRTASLLDTNEQLLAEVADRRKAQNALSESEERYRKLVELAPDAIAVRSEGRFVFANAKAAALLGAESPAALLGRDVLDFVQPGFQQLVSERIREMADGVTVPIIELGLLRLDGLPITAEVAGAPILFEGKPGGQLILRDVSERKEAERLLRVAEQKYEAIFESVNDAIFVHDPESGSILDVNQKMTELWGYTPDEARQLTIEAISAGDPPYSQANAQGWLGKAWLGPPQLFEWHAKDKAGRLFWVEVNIKRAKVGNDDRLLALVRDITDRKRAEAALIASEQRFRAIFEHSALGITLVDSRAKIVDVNPAMQQMLGRSRNELIGVDFTLFTHPETWKLQRKLHAALMRRERDHYQLDKRYTRKDGTEMLGRWTSSIIQGPDGSLLRLSMVEDITERERALEELKRLRREWDDVFDGVTDSVMILDTNQRIVAANAATTEYLGRPAEQLLGKHCYEVCHESDAPLPHCPALHALSSQDRATRQIQMDKLGGTFLVSCTPTFDASGNIDRIIHTAKDITALHSVTEELRRMRTDWETIFQSIEHPTMILQPDHTIIAVNAATVAISGKSESEFTGKKCYEVFHSTHQPIEACPLEQALLSRQTERQEIPLESLHGQFVISCSPVFSESGEIEKITHMATDVSDRVRAELELRDNQARLRAVFETLRIHKTGRFDG